jgi:glycosyltransferase involved in cell wall biosynthesis
MMSGAALVIQRLAEGMAGRKHSVMVLTASCQGMAYTEDLRNLKIVRLQSHRNPLRVDQNFVAWSKEKIAQELQVFQPEILHTHDPLNLGLAAVRANRPGNAKVVFTIHQLPWFITSYLPLQKGIKKVIERRIWQYSQWFMQQCHGIITPSQKIAEIVGENSGFYPEVISNGVDLELFTPLKRKDKEVDSLCEKYNLCPDDPVILYVGRIDPDKRVDLVIKAAARVMQEAKVQLFVVGDGTQREELIQMSRSLGIQEKCCFPGFISKYEDLPGIYRLATVFATASEIEIQSSVVMEAAASGLPVVTVNASSMSEFVLDEKSGFLVPPGDLALLAKKLLHLVQNRSLANSMSRTARELAETHSHEQFLNKHENIYERIFQFDKNPENRIIA